jgi:hypothetical protein
MSRYLLLIAAAGLVLTGCSDIEPPAAAPTTIAPVASSSPTVDPYDAYLAKAPAGEKKLSREDAAIRAQLGCGKAWAPGTVDAVLAEAYASFCK